MTYWTKVASSAFRFHEHLTKRTELITSSRGFCQCAQFSRSYRRLGGTRGRPYIHSIRRNGSLGPEKEVAQYWSFGDRIRALFKPFSFTVLVSVVSFSGAIVWQYETLRGYFKQSQAVETTHNHDYYGKAGSLRHHINVWWNSLSPARKLAAEIIGLNMAVFMLWRVRPLEQVMNKYFLSSIFSAAPCRSMLLSTFSHRSTIHLGVNMFVLWNFSEPLAMQWGKEQFLGFYLSAGVVASLLSYARNVARLSAIPSLGASGAIMGLIGAVCCQFPDARLSILFINQIIPHSFSADSALKGLVLFEVCGILLGFGRLDHAAHLGGLLFGIWYHKYGKNIIWKEYREPLMKAWHQLRGKV